VPCRWHDYGCMSRDVLRECRKVAQFQDGVISRVKALASGASPDVIDRLLGSERWQKIHRGVYLVSSGPPTRNALLWAATCRAGSGAALSHETAAELFKLTDRNRRPIHVTIPANRRISPMKGIVVHHSNRLADAIHPSLMPPRTRLEETVLDLVDHSAVFDSALDIACAACQRGLTTVPKIVIAMGLRAKLKWRGELATALGEIGSGVHSVLEYRYLHKVERPHGLPEASRQARVDGAGRTRYLDNLYMDYALCVELDGLQAHPAEKRWEDLRRVNSITENGKTVLRYGWIDVDRLFCETAGQVGTVLRHLGWRGRLRACGPSCAVGRI
jgi:hypothetical protein